MTDRPNSKKTLAPDEPRQRHHRSKEVKAFVRANPGRTFDASEVADSLNPPWNNASTGTVLRRWHEDDPEGLVIVRRGHYRWVPRNSSEGLRAPGAPNRPQTLFAAPEEAPPAPEGPKRGRPAGSGQASFPVTVVTERADGSKLVRTRNGDLYTMKPFKF